MSTKIKICGLFRDCDAQYVNEARPDYAGFVIYPPSRRNISAEHAASLRRMISPDIKTVGVFIGADIDFIARLFKTGTISIAQLHGMEDKEYIDILRKAAPGCEIWKAFTVKSEGDLKNAALSNADMVLLDNGYGTGERFDWSLINGLSRPFILAGGLTPDNIGETIKRFHPCAVDISSGVETDRVKDKYKILAAVNTARGRPV
ncbi:MAG: phosphoribosylanthranilate isomerase [Oscillospiraceae bacterium]